MTDKSETVFTRKLQRPITAHGETLEEISFREPTAADISRYGNPVRFNLFGDTSDISFYEDKMTAMLAQLSGVNPKAIESMSTQDWTSCAWGIAGFFLPVREKEASTPQ